MPPVWQHVTIPPETKVDPSTFFPADMCCNCGTRDHLKVIKTNLRRTRYFIIFGFEHRLNVPLPFCSFCAITAEMRPPGTAGAIVWWVIWSFFAWCGVMMTMMTFEWKTRSAGWIFVGLAVTMAFVMAAWFRRSPRGNRSSDYQPVRLETNFDPSRWAAASFAFAPPAYAGQVPFLV